MRQLCYHSMLLAATLAMIIVAMPGCGTTRSSDTGRTATEQLLISDAIDRAVQSVNFGTLAGQSVYLDDSRLNDVVDRNYLVSTLRQHLLASGCSLRDKAAAADYVVEVRAGAVGTDRNDLLFGVPSMNVPQFLPVQPVPAAIPEIPVAKRRDQRGVAKIAVFAYHRESGTPVWQSGVAQRESSSNDVWILGAGPFQRGTIYEGTEFAGKSLGNASESENAAHRRSTALANEQLFTPPARIAASQPPKPAEAAAETTAVRPAALQQPVASAKQLPSLESRAAALTAGSIARPRPTADSAGMAVQLSEEQLLRHGEPRPFDPMLLPQPRNDGS